MGKKNLDKKSRSGKVFVLFILLTDVLVEETKGRAVSPRKKHFDSCTAYARPPYGAGVAGQASSHRANCRISTVSASAGGSLAKRVLRAPASKRAASESYNGGQGQPLHCTNRAQRAIKVSLQ